MILAWMRRNLDEGVSINARRQIETWLEKRGLLSKKPSKEKCFSPIGSKNWRQPWLSYRATGDPKLAVEVAMDAKQESALYWNTWKNVTDSSRKSKSGRRAARLDYHRGSGSRTCSRESRIDRRPEMQKVWDRENLLGAFP